MGATLSHHHDSQAQAYIQAFSHALQASVPDNRVHELGPDGEMLPQYPMSPRLVPRFQGGGGGRPWHGGYMGRGDTLCGYCGDVAHPGGCDGAGGAGMGMNVNPGVGVGMGLRGESFRRPRYGMRGGDGPRVGEVSGLSVAEDIAAGLHNLNATLQGNGFGMGMHQNSMRGAGGCGPSCSANDGGIRVKGSVGDHDIDIKLGGKQKCPCDESGGCETSHKKAKSRSRSRKRREKRGRRRGRRRDRDGGDEESSDGEQSRGRRRDRGPIRGGGGGGEGVFERSPGVQPRLSRLEEDVHELNNGWQFLRDRLQSDMAQFPARPDLGLPDGSPFERMDMPMGGPVLGPVPPDARRRRRPKPPIAELDDFDILPPRRGPPGRFNAGLSRYPRMPEEFDADMGPDLNLGDELGLGRGRPFIKDPRISAADLVCGMEDIEEEPPTRGGRGMPRRVPPIPMPSARGRRLGAYRGARPLRPRARGFGPEDDLDLMSGGRPGFPNVSVEEAGQDDGFCDDIGASHRAEYGGSCRPEERMRREESSRPGSRPANANANVGGEKKEDGTKSA